MGDAALTLDEVYSLMTPPARPLPPGGPPKQMTPGQKAVADVKEYVRLKVSMAGIADAEERIAVRDEMRELRADICAYLEVPYRRP